MFPIYIPSKGRAGSATTCANLDSVDRDYTLITTPEEADAYRSCYNGTVLPLQREGMRIGQIRNLILNHAQEQEWIWMIDDDLLDLFYGHGKSKQRLAWTVLAHLEQIISHMADVAQVGLCSSFSLEASAKTLLRYNTSCYHLHALHMPSLHTLRYDERLFFFDDMDFSMRLLQQGLRNARLLSYSYTIKPVGNTPGGLFDRYKTEDRLAEAQMLQREYGDDIIFIRPPSSKNPEWVSAKVNWKTLAKRGGSHGRT